MKKNTNKLSVMITHTMLITFISSLFSITQVFAAGSLKLQVHNTIRSTSSNQLSPCFKIYNTGSTSVSLSNVKVRYYFTADNTIINNLYIDYASIGNYNVSGTIVNMSTTDTKADTYLELSFTSGAGSLSPNGSIEVVTRIAKQDWSNMNQSNDYSYNSNASYYVDWALATAYLSGTLQWGNEPIASFDEQITRTSLKYEAESGIPSSTGMIVDNAFCSGGKYVDILLRQSIVLNIVIPVKGLYTVTIYYRTNIDKTLNFAFTQENFSNTYTLSCPGNVYIDNIGSASMDVLLNAGSYQLKLDNSTNFAPDVDYVTISRNLVPNMNFETGTGTFPTGWTTDYSGVSWDITGGIDGSKAIKMVGTSVTGNVECRTDDLTLEPFKYYRAEVMVKTSITSSKDNYGFQGGDIAVSFRPSTKQNEWIPWGGYSQGERSNSGWKKVMVNFQAPESGKVKIYLRLNNAVGTAWFDNVKLYTDDSIVKMETKNLMFGYERESIINSGITPTNLKLYMDDYERMFVDNAALTGLNTQTHFAGQKLKVLSRGSDFPFGGEASCHTYTWFHKINVLTDLKTKQDYNAFTWGLPHEIGHAFDINQWNFDGELWGSFKAYSSLQRLNSVLQNNDLLFGGSGNPAVDMALRPNAVASMDNGVYNGDFIIVKLGADYRAQVTWEPFTKTFQFFADPANALRIPGSRLGKFNLFLDKLDQYASELGYYTPVRSFFTSQELNIITSHYSN